MTTLDALGRAVEIDSIDAGGVTRSSVQMVYTACGCSPLGKLWKKSQPYAPNGTVYWTVYTYDGLGRTTSVQAPDGSSTTTYSYSGRTVTVTDPAGVTKTFTMDAFGNIVEVDETDPEPGRGLDLLHL